METSLHSCNPTKIRVKPLITMTKDLILAVSAPGLESIQIKIVRQYKADGFRRIHLMMMEEDLPCSNIS